MRKTLLLALREYKVSVRTKGFIIGLLLAPFLMGGSALAMILLKDRVDTTDRNIVVIDHSNQVFQALIEYADNRNQKYIFDENTGKQVRPAFVLESVNPENKNLDSLRLALSNQIRKGSLYGFIEIGPEVVHPYSDPELHRLTYYAKNSALDEMRSWFEYPINNHLRHLRLTEQGIDESDVNSLLTWLNVESMSLVTQDAETGSVKQAQRSSEAQAILTPIAMIMLMMLMVMMGAAPLISSILEEKSQRIAEIVLGSVKPSQFMAGKLIGGIGVALTSSSVYVIGATVAISLLGYDDFIPYHLLPWFFAFMIFGILIYGSMFVSLGAACNDNKEAQTMSFVAMFPVMIPMFLLMPVLREPTTGFATGMSMFPLFTPMLMLLRLSSPTGIPMWQAWVGLIEVIITTVIIVWAGGRIFRVAILMQGTPPKMSNIVKWALHG